MKFASLIPSMFGNQEKGCGGGDGNSPSFNMSDIMSMMSSMNMGGGGKKGKTAINKEALRKLAKRTEPQRKRQHKK